MKIAIIGGSGFVGTRLIELLKSSGFEILNIDKQGSRFHPEITSIGNVLDKAKIAELLKDADAVILLAAEHRDDVSPISLYYDVNVQGMKNTLEAMEFNGIKHLIFTSSVAIYGLNKINPAETHPADPFNHYGKSKWEAEQILQEWYRTHNDWNIDILRPTVIFGERNRGNVYNLLKQIASGRFLMIGSGKNIKSMAYVGNVVSFIKFLIYSESSGYDLFNYVDKPDFSTNELVSLVGRVLKKNIPSFHLPICVGMLGGYCFDILALLMRRKLMVSSVRIKKFCATTQFDASKLAITGFVAPFSLEDALSRTLIFEFLNDAGDGVIFESE